MTTLLMLNSNGRSFRAEASISQAELPTMRECGEMFGYIVRAEPDSMNLYSMLNEAVVVPAECMPEGVAAFWLGRGADGAIDPRRSFAIKDAS